MAEQKRRFKAEIGGKVYTIVGSSSTAHMQAVTALMNEQLETLKTLAPKMTREEAATLLAFNALSDQLNMKAEQEKNQSASDEG